MIPYAIDPSLHAAEPEQLRLDDGCSAPTATAEVPEPQAGTGPVSLEEALAGKSDF